MPPLPTTAHVMHWELPAGRPARSSCCWGTGGKRVTTFRTTETGEVHVQSPEGPGGSPSFLPGLAASRGEAGQRQRAAAVCRGPRPYPPPPPEDSHE